MKQKQHICYKFTYHLKHCLGLWWMVENYGQTRLELGTLSLQSSWLIFHSFLPEMLTHQVRVPGRVSAVSRATAAGNVPASLTGQLGKWRAERSRHSSGPKWKRQNRQLGCPLLRDCLIKGDTFLPNFVIGRTKLWLQVIQTLWPLHYLPSKNFSVAPLF